MRRRPFVGPISTKQRFTQRSSGSIAMFCCSALYVAFAIAEFRHLEIGCAARLSVNLRIASAFETFTPRIKSITSRALRGLPFKYFVFAIASIISWQLQKAVGSQAFYCLLLLRSGEFLFAICCAVLPGCALEGRLGDD